MQSRFVLPAVRFVLPLVVLSQLLPAFNSICLADDLPFYIKKGTWYETLLASREAMTRHRKEMRKSLGLKLGPWRSLGPFRGGSPYATEFGPEKDLTASKTFEKGLSWVSHPEWQDGTIVALPGVDKSAKYRFREIVSVRARPLTLYLGSDDGIRVWLNGQLVMEHDINRSCQRNQEVVTVNLKKGIDRLLLKVSNGNGPTAFYFSIDDLDPLTLWKRVREDFDRRSARDEMDQEMIDGIWDAEWHCGEYITLAKRYIKAAEKRAATVELAFTPTAKPKNTLKSLWSLLCSPLLIGCDMTRLDEFTLSLMTNDEVLAVNQDPLGKQAARIKKDGDVEVWAKPMEDGSHAVGLFNRGEKSNPVRVTWGELGLTGPKSARDLWRQKDLGTVDGKYGVVVARHGASLITLR